jgi:hypothetical protein
MGTAAQKKAGSRAKKQGHVEESKSADRLTESTGFKHITDGANNTKRDVICDDLDFYYSQKSVSKDHTQCHLTSWKVWCDYFNIDGELRQWFSLFFGTPGEDVSNGAHSQHRIVNNAELNTLGIKWFNDHKMETFDAIVRKGIYLNKKTKQIAVGEPVNKMIWYNKKTKDLKTFDIQTLADVVEGGYWELQPTTLWFIDANGNKLFHLQMKGSGEKFTSGYHSLMFHIYKPQV